MKIIVALLIALALGIAIGVGVAWLRVRSVPWDGPPAQDAAAESDASVSSDGSPAPVAAVDRLDYDFGTLDVEKSGREEFTVTNRGNAVLKLTKGSTTCRCTASDLERSELPPGESTKITLNWRPTADVGPYEQSATFLTNDPDRPRFVIKIKGKITASIRARPATLTLSRISGHETSQGSLAILNYLDEPLTLGDPRFEENGIRQFFDATVAPLTESELKEQLGAKSGFKLTVAVKPGLPQGAFKQTITLSTNNPNKKELTIPVEGTIGTEISVVGPNWDTEHDVLYLGTVKSDEGYSSRLLLVVHGPYRRETHFKLAAPPPVPLSVTFGEMTEINNGQVTQTPLLIEIPKGSPGISHLGHTQENGKDVPDDSATIVIETTHPEIAKFRIPVRFAVEK
jgi:hypothetical protein